MFCFSTNQIFLILFVSSFSYNQTRTLTDLFEKKNHGKSQTSAWEKKVKQTRGMTLNEIEHMTTEE